MFDVKNIPLELRESNQWVGVGKSKLPLMRISKTGTAPASSSDPATWTSFDSITKGIQDGVFEYYGYVFNDSGVVGIDLDDSFTDDGFLSTVAIDVMKHCKSYTEYSRSHTGLHIYVRGNLPFKGRNNLHGVEIYKTGRYFIVTGAKLIYPEMIENQEAIDYVVAKYFPEKVKTATSKTTPNIYQPVTKVSVGQKIVIETDYPEIGEGGRNVSLASLAGQLHNQGYPKSAIFAKISKINAEKCKPPLSYRELKTIVNSITRYTRERR
jgi:primase-polymerase (primpol)-like protein